MGGAVQLAALELGFTVAAVVLMCSHTVCKQCVQTVLAILSVYSILLDHNPIATPLLGTCISAEGCGLVKGKVLER